jgi:hypothetical protein
MASLISTLFTIVALFCVRSAEAGILEFDVDVVELLVKGYVVEFVTV